MVFSYIIIVYFTLRQLQKYPYTGDKMPSLTIKTFLKIFNRDVILGIVLAATTFVAYMPAWNGELLWDDDAVITAPALQSADGLARIWTQPGATQQYYPLHHSVSWIEYHLWSDTMTGYHLTTILLHILSALLLLATLRRLRIPGAWLAAFIFSLHPVQVESVAWITEIKNTLSAVFFFAAALAYLKWADLNSSAIAKKKNYGGYLFALVLFTLGLASKTAIVTFPGAMLAVVWWKRGSLSFRRDILPLIPLCVIGAGFAYITMHVEHINIGAESQYFGYTIMERCIISGKQVWFYLGKIFWPTNLIFIFPQLTVNQSAWQQYLYPLATLGFGAVLWAIRRRSRAPLAAYLFYLAMLIPVLGFFNQYGFRFSFVACHWIYLPIVGPIVLFAAAVDRVLKRLGKKNGRLIQSALVVLIATLAVLSWQQSRNYTDSETLYRSIIKDNNACWMAHNNLGILLQKTGRTEEAVDQFRAALEFFPDYSAAHYNLANALRETGYIDEAIAHFRRALEIHPNNATTHLHFGDALMQAKRDNEGIAEYTIALQLNPGLTGAHYNLGCALFRAGRLQEAIAELQTALDCNPGDMAILSILHNAFVKNGQISDAILIDRRAIDVAHAKGDEAMATAIENDIATLSKNTAR